MNLLNDIIERMHQKMLAEIDDIILEGLKRKGYTYQDLIDGRARCEHNIDKGERIYFIDNIPFLLWIENKTISMPKEDEKGNITAKAELGKYVFL